MRALLLVAALAAPALAQPAVDANKGDAKALMQSGVKLFEAKDYLGALAVFKDAYARFPSAKILLNIGTTLKLLDRNAEAANAYQRYLDSSDADPAKKPEVASVLAELDKKVGTLEITVTPTDAEVQLDDGEWGPAANVKVVRVKDGAFTVRARKDKFQTEAKSAHIAAGEKAAVVIALTAIPEPKAPTAPIVVEGPRSGIVATVAAPAPRSPLAVLALAHIEPTRGGGAALVGLAYEALPMLQVEAAAIINFNYPGGYAGASLALLQGELRPIVVAGLPMFSSNGIRVAARGAGGAEWVVSRHVALIAEVGIDYWFNPEMNYKNLVFAPALGITGRM